MVEQNLLVITSGSATLARLLAGLAGASSDTLLLRVDVTTNIHAAQLHGSANAVHVILLDLETPGANEAGALALAIQAFAPIPVLVWMASGRSGLELELLAQGAAACLNDTVSASDLILQILSLVIRHAESQHSFRQQQQHTAISLEAIADGVICTNSRAEITFLNSAARRLLHYPSNELIGRQIAGFMAFQDAENREALVHPVHQVISTLQSARVNPGTILIRHDGTKIRIEDSCSPIIDESGALVGAVMVFHDTTEAYEMQAKVDHLAWHDFLTGLPNRFAIQRHVDRALAHAATHRQSVQVLYLDLDKFKLVNDTLGHDAGDKLLVSVAERLRGCFRLIDLVGRQGGDEFVVVMAPGSSTEEAMLAAARIVEALARPHQISGNDIRIGCSAGIASYPEHGTTVEMLLQHADIALQSVKSGGRNGWRVFTHELHADTLERQRIEERLRLALNAGTFSLFYQPKIRFPGGKVCGCEALLRWHEAEWGWVAPTKFIPCAEASGLINALGRWVFDEALRQAQAWTRDGVDFGTIAINVSAEELRHPEFVDYIRTQLQASNIDPALLQLELTESVLMHDIGHASRSLRQLKELGLTLAIDDFGTGYSSLSYLADFPVDVLKIDRSFIHGINRAGTRQQALLHAILTLAKSLTLVVVAEGIETAEEEHFLLQSGCEVGQGYYYSQPLDLPSFERFLSSAGAYVT